MHLTKRRLLAIVAALKERVAAMPTDAPVAESYREALQWAELSLAKRIAKRAHPFGGRAAAE